MTAQSQVDEAHELDEGSWAYLSLWGLEQRDLHRHIVDACEASGWPAVSWSPVAHEGNVTDSARFFEGMGHAVEHADVVIALVDTSSAMTDAELAFAYRHNRPVIGLRVGGREEKPSPVQAMLRRYGRGRLIDCADIDECSAGLRDALADPE
ncbi:MAG TPA: hypothetical protein VF259_00790, partial [Solirubrobacterales bacterium]